tara:strand:+ start:733 stop:1011 length:279 start_codon:yes stop_codon:yes gene_type:complete
MEISQDVLVKLFEQQARCMGYALAAVLEGSEIDPDRLRAALKKATDLAYLATEDEVLDATKAAAVAPLQALAEGVEDFLDDLEKFGTPGEPG